MVSSLLSVVFTLADGAAPAAGGGAPGGPPGILAAGGQFVPLIGIAFLFYFLIWRPQSKQRRETEAMLKALKKGDEVVTSGGLIGKISGLTETEVTLEVQEKVRLKVQRSHVVSKYVPGAKAAPAESSATTTTK